MSTCAFPPIGCTLPIWWGPRVPLEALGPLVVQEVPAAVGREAQVLHLVQEAPAALEPLVGLVQQEALVAQV